LHNVSTKIIRKTLAVVVLIAGGYAVWHYFPRAAAPTVFGWTAQVGTAAGDGTPGMLDGPTAQARFADPYGLAQDAAGNLFIADGGENNRIRKITAEGLVVTFAGGAEGFTDGAQGTFNTPSGLAFDHAGNLLVADTGNNAIRRISPQGLVTTLAGNGSAGYRDGRGAEAQFNGPLAVAVDNADNVYVADTYNDRLRKISTDGVVSTIAGAGTPGYLDGPAATARFDTPAAMTVDAAGALLIADTKNSAIRKLSPDGQVSTLARSLPDQRDALLRRPLSLALTHDGYLYVGDMARGRILQISPAGEIKGLSGLGIDFQPGDETVERFRRPAGMVLARSGAMYVTDAANFALRRLEPRVKDAPLVARLQPVLRKLGTMHLPWPVNPASSHHEIVGTVGEVRGNYEGESRDHFHAGLDVQAALGVPVHAILDEKIVSPLPNWGEGGLNEGMAINEISYVHMKVGRSPQDEALDPARFVVLRDEAGKPRVRVKRGTRFKTGDVLGTVNRMYHTHLEYSQGNADLNPLVLPLPGIADRIAPTIESITLVDQNGQHLGKARKGRLLVPATGEFGIVVDAWDSMDGTLARRRLGLYQLGYQLLRADGSAAPGYETPLMTMKFDRLPPDRESVKLAYADSSGITEQGAAMTRFLYMVTNTVRDGMAHQGSWKPAALPPGDYLLRIVAADFAGNVAAQDRDLPLTIE
jgi:sugar lactone lactonase YvrE